MIRDIDCGSVLFVRSLQETTIDIDLATTKMSSRGQVVIPESIQSEMGLEAGSKFIVMWHGDVLMLKVISPPSLDEFKAVQKRLQQAGKKRNSNAKTLLML